MIKIGHAWVDMDSVSAICETRSESGYSIFLNSGCIIGLPDVTEEEIICVLERCGMIECSDSLVDATAFTSAELAEMLAAYRDGFRWAAQDANGKSYAYEVKPEKLSFAWSEASGAIRGLKSGDYDALSFDHDEPLELSNLFRLEETEDDGPDQ